jgi:hypothetical protein
LGRREGRAHRKNKLDGEVWLAGGERWWGQHPGVVVNDSGCREVVHGDAVLGAWSKRSERGRSELSATAGMAAQWGTKSGGGRKGAPRWGWAPFIAARGDGRQRRGNGGGRGAVGAARQRPPLSEGGRCGPDAVGPWFGPDG